MNKLPTDGLLSLEQPFIKVPLEQYKKAAKASQKLVDKELSSVVTTLESLESKLQTPETFASKEDVEKTAVLNALQGLESKLQSLKRKLSDYRGEEEVYGSRTRSRLEYLSQLSNIPGQESEEYDRWSRTRLNRILVDYLLRQGMPLAAERLASDTGIKEYVDLELFAQSRKIELAIKNHSCAEALAWCKENGSSLKKIKSTLEFSLRFQEFVELVRKGNLTEAIVYVKKYLAPWSSTHLREIQQGMALLAFRPNTSCGIYKALFDESRWDKLVQEFKKNNYELHSLTSQSPLDMTLQVGLSALKTPGCYQEENQNVQCPVCAKETLGKLAQGLPFAHHVNSCLVCRISGEIMNEHNPPLVLPNGYVYSRKALEEQAEKRQRNSLNSLETESSVICPRTGEVVTLSQCRKAFIL